MTAAIFAILCAAIGERESNNNPRVGDGAAGEVGQYQIRQIVVDDVNRIYDSKFTLDDARKPDRARHIMYLYLTHWGKKFEAKHDRSPTIAEFAQIWNGGPDGAEKKCTAEYGNAVAAIYNRRYDTGEWT